MNSVLAIKKATHQNWTVSGKRIPVTILSVAENVVISKGENKTTIGFGKKKELLGLVVEFSDDCEQDVTLGKREACLTTDQPHTLSTSSIAVFHDDVLGFPTILREDREVDVTLHEPARLGDGMTITLRDGIVVAHTGSRKHLECIAELVGDPLMPIL
jgi:hypothetical protein